MNNRGTWNATFNDIFLELEFSKRKFLRYRIIITDDIIECKLTPKNHNESEINYIFDNDEDGRISLFGILSSLNDK